jgi:PAS domain S-box-containing protein
VDGHVIVFIHVGFFRGVCSESGGLTMSKDRTDRHQNEDSLKVALVYAETIIASLRDPLVVLNSDLRVKSANRSFFESFHVSKEETENRLLNNLGNGQWDIPLLRTLLTEVLSKSHPVHEFEVEHNFPEIGQRTMLLNARKFSPGSNISPLILLAIEDVTDRKLAEAALKGSEIRYRRLFESAKDGILILDAQTLKIIDSNPFMTDILGYSHDEFLGKELWEIGLFTDKEASQSAYRELQKNGFIRYHNLPLESKNGEKVEVEFVSNVYAENDHEVIQCNVRDITERCRSDRQMQEQAAAFADLDHRKDEFLAMLSHELRNPLAPILNAVQLLQVQKGVNPVQQKAQTIIERQVGQLTHLVDDLLDVSRTISGRIRLRREQVALSGIVERGVETVRPLIDQRKHELTVSLPADPIWLNADSARIEQIVTNLLSNAVKYTNEGGHIWLSVQQEGDKAVLSVRDTGVGITPAFLPHIFDLFTQAERSSDRLQGGLGIGLALVKRLVEMHEGTIGVSSTLGQGSEFVVTLAVVRSMALSRATQLPQTESAMPTSAVLRVLVVDDNVDAATALEMLLQASGHLVQVAHTGPTGLAAALDFRPDVVLLDIGLPELDGWRVAKRIRQRRILRNVVLVAMTGYGQSTDRRRSQKAGFDHHLVKPVYFGELRQILLEVSEKAA